jgi:hypothetical protein
MSSDAMQLVGGPAASGVALDPGFEVLAGDEIQCGQVLTRDPP